MPVEPRNKLDLVELQQGATTEVEFTVENPSSSDQRFKLDFEGLPIDWIENQPRPRAISARESVMFTLVIKVPSDAPMGDRLIHYYLMDEEGECEAKGSLTLRIGAFQPPSMLSKEDPSPVLQAESGEEDQATHVTEGESPKKPEEKKASSAKSVSSSMTVVDPEGPPSAPGSSSEPNMLEQTSTAEPSKSSAPSSAAAKKRAEKPRPAESQAIGSEVVSAAPPKLPKVAPPDPSFIPSPPQAAEPALKGEPPQVNEEEDTIAQKQGIGSAQMTTGLGSMGGAGKQGQAFIRQEGQSSAPSSLLEAHESALYAPELRLAVVLSPGDTRPLVFAVRNTHGERKTYRVRWDTDLMPQNTAINPLRDQVTLDPEFKSDVGFSITVGSDVPPGQFELAVSLGTEGKKAQEFVIPVVIRAIPSVQVHPSQSKIIVGPLSREIKLPIDVSNIGNCKTAYRIVAATDDETIKVEGARPIPERSTWNYFWDSELGELPQPKSNQPAPVQPHEIHCVRKSPWWFGWVSKRTVGLVAQPVEDAANGGKSGNSAEIVVSAWRLMPVPWFIWAPLLVFLLLGTGFGAKAEFTETINYSRNGVIRKFALAKLPALTDPTEPSSNEIPEGAESNGSPSGKPGDAINSTIEYSIAPFSLLGLGKVQVTEQRNTSNQASEGPRAYSDSHFYVGNATIHGKHTFGAQATPVLLNAQTSGIFGIGRSGDVIVAYPVITRNDLRLLVHDDMPSAAAFNDFVENIEVSESVRETLKQATRSRTLLMTEEIPMFAENEYRFSIELVNQSKLRGAYISLLKVPSFIDVNQANLSTDPQKDKALLILDHVKDTSSAPPYSTIEFIVAREGYTKWVSDYDQNPLNVKFPAIILVTTDEAARFIVVQLVPKRAGSEAWQ